MSDPKYLFGGRRFSVYAQRTPAWWWFRIVSFQSGPDHDRRNGWHFYVPFLRFTRSAVR
jgi:hypothetical protein